MSQRHRQHLWSEAHVAGSPDPTLGAVIGRQLADLRAARGLTQTDAARLLQDNGLRWSRDQVQFLESGKREGIEVRELIALAVTFRAPLSYWLEGAAGLGPGDAPGRWAALDEQMQVDLDWVGWLLAGGNPARNSGGFYGDPVGAFPDSFAETSEYALVTSMPIMAEEKRAAQRLGVTPEAVRSGALRLWGEPLPRRRDREVGTEAMTTKRRAARRGHVTRVLLAELRATIEENDP